MTIGNRTRDRRAILRRVLVATAVVALAVPAVAAGATSYRAAVLADAPIAYWRLGETIGTIAADETGAHPGSYLGGVALSETGALTGDLNTAARFDGVDDQVTVPHATTLSATSAVTVEFWMRRTTSGANQVLVGKPGNGRSKFENYAVWLNTRNRLQAYFGNGGSVASVTSPGPIDTAWHHVAATYDNAVARLYVDAVQVASRSSSVRMAGNTNPLNIGRANNGSAAFGGSLDEVAIYGAALSQTSLRAHVDASAGDVVGPAVSLIAPAAVGADTTPTLQGGAGTAPDDLPTVTAFVVAGSSASGTPVRTMTTTAVGASWAVDVAPPLADGVYTARAEQRDAAGNIGQSAPRTFTVDTVAPTTTITSGPTDPDTSTSATFAFTASEASATFECRLDASPFSACTSPATVTALAAGTHTFGVRATDAAGNVGATAERTWTLTPTAPIATITSAPPDPAASTSASFAFSSTTPGATFACALDTATFSACASPIAYQGLSETTHTFQVRATASGITGPAAQHTWRVAVPPVVTLTAPANGSTTSSHTPTLAGVGGTLAGDAATVTVRIYAGTAATGTAVQNLTAPVGVAGAWSTAPTTPLAAGTFTARAEQLDAAGNIGRSAANTFTIQDPQTDVRLIGSGDIAGCWSGGILPGSLATAALLDLFPNDLVQTFGDNAYDHGSAQEFANCYEPTWGRAKSRTRPAIGDHEYDLSTLAPGYFSYFQDQLAPLGATASDPGKAYYSYEHGSWHVVVLNGACPTELPGCDVAGQERWFAADLAAHPTSCTAVVVSSPRFSSGNIHGNNPAMQSLWQLSNDAGVELWLSGDDHVYERFAPMNGAGQLDRATGVRQFIVGTGGYLLYGLGTRKANSEVFNSDAFGIIRLTLSPTGYSWQFVPEAGKTFTDSGSDTCHSPAPPPAGAPSVRASTSSTMNDATSLALAKPAGATSGDLLVAIVGHQGGTTRSMSAPAGWTAIPNTDLADGTNAHIHSWYRIATATEPAAYTFTLTGGSGMDVSGGITAITGASVTNPIDASSGQLNTSGSTSLTAPSVTTSVANALLIYGVAVNTSTLFAPPAGMVELWDAATSGTYRMTSESASQPLSDAGPTGTRTATAGTGIRGAAITIAIRPVSP